MSCYSKKLQLEKAGKYLTLSLISENFYGQYINDKCQVFTLWIITVYIIFTL